MQQLTVTVAHADDSFASINGHNVTFKLTRCVALCLLLEIHLMVV